MDNHHASLMPPNFSKSERLASMPTRKRGIPFVFCGRFDLS